MCFPWRHTSPPAFLHRLYFYQYFCLICVSKVQPPERDRESLHQAEARLQVITLSSEGGEEGGEDGDQARCLH